MKRNISSLLITAASLFLAFNLQAQKAGIKQVKLTDFQLPYQ
jgi:hypothetical protein